MVVEFVKLAEPIPGYKLLEPLGKGGFGEVWKAEAPGGLLKAIKLVHGSLRSGHGDEAMVQQELTALSCVKGVRHPYILSMDRFDVIDGQLIIVMELADQNLWDRFTEYVNQGKTGIPRAELLRYLEEAAEALDLMNMQYKLQHSDIKPQNLFLVHNHIKVADFGLVKDLKGMKALAQGCFSPLYAAPETFEGWVSPRSDQYSLAIVYQELLTGQRPFDGKNARQLLLQHVQEPPNLGYLPPADRDIVGKALAKKQEERFACCMDLVRALRKAEAAGASSAPETSSASPAGAAKTTLSGAMVIQCPQCGFRGRIPKQFRGQAVKCRACGQMFQALSAAETVLPGMVAAGPKPGTSSPESPGGPPLSDTQKLKLTGAPPAGTPPKPLPTADVQAGPAQPSPSATQKLKLQSAPPAQEAATAPQPALPAAAPQPLQRKEPPPELQVECSVCGELRHAVIELQKGTVKCLNCGCVQSLDPAGLADRLRPALAGQVTGLVAPAKRPSKVKLAPARVVKATPPTAPSVPLIEVECPVCGQVECVPAQQAGTALKCRQCGCSQRIG